MDSNNNNVVTKSQDDEFDYLKPENVEEELAKLKLLDEAYDSEDDTRDKVRLTGNGIDVRSLRAGQDIEFEYDMDKLDDPDCRWEDEEEGNRVDFKKIYEYRNSDMLLVEDENETDENSPSGSAKTPFEILRAKMTDISPEKNNGVLKRMLIPGAGILIPDGSRVRIHYNAYFELNDEPFDSTYLRNKSFEFKLGANQVVQGLDIAVASMKRHEKSQFIFEPSYFMGEMGCEPRVPKSTPVLFEIEVLSFIEANVYEKYEQSSEEQRAAVPFKQIVRIANCLRELGNDHYKREEIKEASKKYRKAIYLLESTSVNSDEDEERWKEVLLKLYLNMSQICVKQSKPKKTIYYCKESLNIDPNNAKALFRYGHSLRLLQSFDRSRAFLTKALKLQPTNKDITTEMQKLDEAVSKYHSLEKSRWQRAFNGGALSDEKPAKQVDTDDFKLDEKNDLTESTKSMIIKRLEDFMADKTATIYKVQMHMYSLDIINFIIAEATAKKLSIRDFKGETHVLQITKSS